MYMTTIKDTTELDVYDDLNIRQFKLTSGEDVIGLITGVDKKTSFILMERPLSLVSENVDVDRQRVYFMDWMPVSKDDIVSISPAHIVSQAEVNNELKESYIKWCLEYDRTSITDFNEDEFGDAEAAYDYAKLKSGGGSVH